MPQFNVGQSLSHPPPRYLRGKEQSTLFSDSDNDKIAMGDVGDLNMTIDSPYSCSFWINVNVDASSGTSETAYHLMGCEQFNARGFSIAYVDGASNNQYIQVRHSYNDGTGRSASVSTTLGSDLEHNRWYHIVYTYTYPDARIYINGVEEAHKDDMPVFNTILDADVFRIGGNGDLNGYFCQASIWERQLSVAEIRRLFNNGFAFEANYGALSLDKLAGYWKLNYEDTAGTGTILDKRARGNNLNTTNLIAGDFNQKAFTDGDVRNKGYLFVPPGTYAEGIGPFIKSTSSKIGGIVTAGSYAISAWIELTNINTTGNGYQILLEDRDQAGDTIYRFGFKDGKPFMYHKQPTSSIDETTISSSALSADTMYHVTYVHRFSGTEYEIFVNGSSVATNANGAWARTYTPLITNYRVGASNSNLNSAGDAYASLDGRIYKLGYFQEDMSDAENDTLYNSGVVKSWVDMLNCTAFLGMGDGPEGREYLYEYGGDNYESDSANTQKIYDLQGNGAHIYLTKEKTNVSYSTNMVLRR